MIVACDIMAEGAETKKDSPTGTAEGKTKASRVIPEEVIHEISEKSSDDDSETAITTAGEDLDIIKVEISVDKAIEVPLDAEAETYEGD